MKNNQTEQTLTERAIMTWQRLRSSDELQSFIGRRELALQAIPVDAYDEL